ncbi:holin [Pandoraea sputorum]|uniref:holin n=1 Tax=Pandoraea sputorum TaxID=93222 RepID=UPI00125C63FC|nr:holin [Pandoraea sputorum]VVE78216.1 holin [Pandoraea sputorum]
MIWVSVFFIANVIVLAGCIWLALSDAITTGFWGTTGFSAIGLASVGNLFKPVWMRQAIDGPEILMLVGLAIVAIWLMARKAYWMNRGRGHGSH